MSDDASPTLDDLREELRAFVAERDWDQFHDPKNLAMLLASEAGELVAELRWVTNAEADDVVDKPEVRARLRAELADVAIALLLLADRTGIDLLAAVADKLVVNRRNYPVWSARGRWDRPNR